MSDDILVLTFEGQQTIEKAVQVKEQLLAAIQGKKKNILLNFSNLEKVDLSFLQMIYAAGKDSVKAKKTFSLTGTVPQSLVDAVLLAGYDKNLTDEPGDIFTMIVQGGENS